MAGRGLALGLAWLAAAAPQAPTRAPQVAPVACPRPPREAAESLAAAGRWWHAERAAPPLPAAPRAVPADLAELRVTIDEALGAWSQVDGILGRVQGADSIPALLLLAARRDEQASRWRAAELRYRRLAGWPSASPAARATAAVRLAITLERVAASDSAAAAWRRAARVLAPVEDWLALRRAALEPDTALAFATVVAPRSPGAAAAAVAFVADRRLAAGNAAGALDLYVRLGKPLDAARAELALGRQGAARLRVDRLLLTDPTRPAALLAANLLVAQFRALTPAELLGVARAYRARHGLPTAERYARRAAARDTGAAGWIEVALIAAARRHPAAARTAIDSAAARERRRPGGPSIAVALAGVQVLEVERRWGAADAALGRLAQEAPGDTAVAGAMLSLADRDRARGADDDALALEQRLARGFVGTAAADVAAYRLALASYAAGRPAAAAAALQAVLAADSAGPRAVAVRYWLGRIAREGGDPAGAADLRAVARLEPTGYYGVRARELLGEPLSLAADSAAGAPALAAAAAAERIRLLAAVGLTAEARAEAVGWIADSEAPATVLAAAAAAADVGLGREAVLLGEAARPRGPLTRAVAEAVFPRPYWGVFVGEAKEACVDPLLLAAIARQESRFQPGARSRAGARGLSQLEPRTAREMAFRLRLRPYSPQLLDVPDFNLHLGARYLRDRMAQGPLPLYALIASYNAGAARIAQWRTWPELHDPDLFVERLSISETRDYVRNVYANYAWYRRLYAAGAGQE